MKKSNIVTALFAVFAAGFLLVSCNNGIMAGLGLGKIDPALVGKWIPEYMMDLLDAYQDIYGDNGYYEFTSDGRVAILGTVIYTYSASGGKITTYYDGPDNYYYKPGQKMESANYTVSGDKLTISYREVGFSILAGDYYRLGSTVTPDEDSGTTGGNNAGDGTNTDFAYTDVSGGVEITDYTGTAKNVSIPATIDGKAVVSIGE